MSSRIAKNTLALYMRMIVVVIVSLYSSRLIINALGEDNYGIYIVVGGITAMLSFLNTTMSGAVSRFINYEIGIGNTNLIAKRFSSALIIQICIAIIFIILAETIGFWFVNHKLVIPADRMMAANYVYQISLLTAVISMIQVPYTAFVISYEKMGVYSTIEIVCVLLKLGCAFLILFDNGDRLKLYVTLIFIAHLLTFTAYTVYTFKKFKSCRFKPHKDWQNIVPMLKFSGWDLYGNISYTSMLQGATILINMFFGAAVNAAGGITMTVSSQVAWLGRNVSLAYRPSIISNFANKKYGLMAELMTECAKLSLLFVMLGTVPLIFNIDYVLRIWLGDVPEYTSVFCKIMLIAGCINTVNATLTTGFHATGNIAKLSIGAGSLYLLTMPTTYLLYKLGMPPYACYITMLAAHILVLFLNSYLFKIENSEFSPKSFLINSIGIHCMTAIPAIIATYVVCQMLSSEILRLVLSSLVFIIVYSALAFFSVLSIQQRAKILTKLHLL